MITLQLKKFKINIGNNFIERVIEFSKSKEVGSTIKKSEDFLLTTVENMTMAEKIL